MAAVLAAGPGSALSHRSSLDIHGVRRSERPRHEVVRVGGSAIRTVDVYRTRSLPPGDVTRIRGIPTTTFARALCDCTPLLTDEALRRAIHEAEILRILDVAAIHHPPPRLAALIADYIPQPANEGLETLFAELIRGIDLPPHELNAHVGAYEVDALFGARRVIVELDDRRAHQTTRAFQSDRAKDAALTALGYRVLRITWHRLTNEPALVTAQLRATLGSPAP
jgi:very-short-patch-repair endonuclease